MSDRNYCYPPDYIVLRNRLDIRDAPTLEAAERQLIAQRLLEPVPTGDFDLNLRRKLGDDAANPAYIFNERDVGYRMAGPGEE